MERSRNAIVLMMGVPSRRFFDLSCFPAPVESLLPWCWSRVFGDIGRAVGAGGPDHGLRQFEAPVVRGGVGGSSLGSFAGRLAALKSGATVTFPEGPAAQRYDGCMACPAQPVVSHPRPQKARHGNSCCGCLNHAGRAHINEVCPRFQPVQATRDTPSDTSAENPEAGLRGV